jgi:hypothetical protein
MSSIDNFSVKNGIKWGVVVVVALLFVPPVVVSWLPIWSDANGIAMQDERLKNACGKNGEISLSRWFYMYKVSGDYEAASFSGSVNSIGCNKKFRIDIERNGGAWSVTKLKLG